MELLAQLTDLIAAFEPMAARAPWVQARFSWQHGVCNGIEFVRPGHNDAESFLPGSQLRAMSAHAGNLAADMYKRGWGPWRHPQRPAVPIEYHLPEERWVDLLTHFPETGHLCYVDRHGSHLPAAGRIDYDQPEPVYIDNYAQVSLIALTCLKTEISRLASDSRQGLENDLRKATDTPPSQVVGPVERPLVEPQFLSASDLAKRLTGRLSLKAVESRLARLRAKKPDCFREVEGRRMNEPQYMYRVADVLPELERGTDEGRAQK
jgi:hypothetical protein